MQNKLTRKTFELLKDTHMLKAQCLWRIESNDTQNPLEAVKNIKLAKRYEQWAKKEPVTRITHNQLVA